MGLTGRKMENGEQKQWNKCTDAAYPTMIKLWAVPLSIVLVHSSKRIFLDSLWSFSFFYSSFSISFLVYSNSVFSAKWNIPTFFHGNEDILMASQIITERGSKEYFMCIDQVSSFYFYLSHHSKLWNAIKFHRLKSKWKFGI